ncbi:MAG: sulfite exporter TauE/SafE family protein [Longimicrobiaceae bacterium]
MTALGLALAALVGLTLGLLGGGGSVLTVPILVYVLGFGAKQAIAMSLGVVGTASLFGSLAHWRSGNVDLRTAFSFGAFAMCGAFLGARLAAFVSGPAQLVAFAVVMVLAALSMLRGGGGMGEADAGPRTPPLLTLAIVGAGVGALTGLVGVGGGFLIVPALVLLARVPMRQAVGTSLLVIAMNSAAGLSGYLGKVEVPWGFMAAFTAVAVGGIVVGARLVRHVPQAALKRGFAVFLLVMGGLILFQNREAILPGGPPEAGTPAGP